MVEARTTISQLDRPPISGSRSLYFGWLELLELTMDGSVSCPICGGSSSLCLTKEDYPYFECAQCNFLFVGDPSSRSGAMAEFYDRRYWELERVEARRREYEDCFVRALELIFVSGIQVDNMLDFGCGLGITVRLLREKLKLNAVGVDVSADFEETEWLHRCQLADLVTKYPSGYFDAILSVEVFEHLDDPKGVLTLLSHLLKPGGKMLINTATREYISAYDTQQTYIDPVERGHISIYSLSSFKVLATSIGYSAEFMGDRKYVVLLSPVSAFAPFPNQQNILRMRALGEWYPALFREYMRLVFLEKEFQEKCVYVNQLLTQVKLPQSKRPSLFQRMKRK